MIRSSKRYLGFLFAALSPVALWAGPLNPAGNIKSVGADSGYDALENPSYLSRLGDKHHIIGSLGFRLGALADSEAGDNASGLFSGGIEPSQMSLAVGYGLPQLVDGFHFGFGMRSLVTEDQLDFVESRNRFSTIRSGSDSRDDQLAVSGGVFSPAVAMPLNKEFHLGLALQTVLKFESASRTSFSGSSYEEVSNFDTQSMLLRPVLGFRQGDAEGEEPSRSEIGIRLIPVFFHSQARREEKYLFDLHETSSNDVEQSAELDNSAFHLGRIELGIKEELIKNFVVSGEGRMAIPYNVEWERMASTLDSDGQASFQRRLYDIEQVTRQGFSVGLTSFHVREMEISLGFSFDSVEVKEALLKSGSSLSNEDNFAETSIQERHYQLTTGLVYRGFDQFTLTANLGVYSKLINKSDASKASFETSTTKSSNVSRDDGFLIELGYLQEF